MTGRDFGWLLCGFLFGWALAFFVAFLLQPYPRTPADWKAGYEAAVKSEQARHAEAMGMGKGELK